MRNAVSFLQVLLVGFFLAGCDKRAPEGPGAADPTPTPAVQTSASTYVRPTAAPLPVGSPGYHWVNGFTRKNGTYVQGHYQTNPDGDKSNNWSTKGNVNPFTGKRGTK